MAHSAWGDVHACGDAGERPSLGVEPEGIVDLVVGQSVSAHRDAVAVEDRADGTAFDTELITQLVNGGAGSVAGDQLLHLVVGELPGASRPLTFRCRSGGHIQVR